MIFTVLCTRETTRLGLLLIASYSSPYKETKMMTRMIRTGVQTKEQGTFKRRREEEENVRHGSEESVNGCLEDALSDAC